VGRLDHIEDTAVVIRPFHREDELLPARRLGIDRGNHLSRDLLWQRIDL
jgi:hypothetical protein